MSGNEDDYRWMIGLGWGGQAIRLVIGGHRGRGYRQDTLGAQGFRCEGEGYR